MAENPLRNHGQEIHDPGRIGRSIKPKTNPVQQQPPCKTCAKTPPMNWPGGRCPTCLSTGEKPWSERKMHYLNFFKKV